MDNTGGSDDFSRRMFLASGASTGSVLVAGCQFLGDGSSEEKPESGDTIEAVETQPVDSTVGDEFLVRSDTAMESLSEREFVERMSDIEKKLEAFQTVHDRIAERIDSVESIETLGYYPIDPSAYDDVAAMLLESDDSGTTSEQGAIPAGATTGIGTDRVSADGDVFASGAAGPGRAVFAGQAPSCGPEEKRRLRWARDDKETADSMIRATKENIDRNKDEIEKFERKIEKLERKRVKLEERLETKASELQKSYNEYFDTYAKKRRAIERKEEQLEQRRKRVAELENNIEELKEKLNTIVSKIKANKSMKEGLEDARSKLEAKEDVADAISVTVAVGSLTISLVSSAGTTSAGALAVSVTVTKAFVKESVLNIAQSMAMEKSQELQGATVEEALGILHHHIFELNVNIKKLKNKGDKIENALNQQQRELEKLRKKIKTCESDLERLQNERDKARTKARAKKDEIENVERKVDGVTKSELKNIEQSITFYRDLKEDNERALENKKESLSTWEKRRRDAENRIQKICENCPELCESTQSASEAEELYIDPTEAVKLSDPEDETTPTPTPTATPTPTPTGSPEILCQGLGAWSGEVSGEEATIIGVTWDVRDPSGDLINVRLGWTINDQPTADFGLRGRNKDGLPYAASRYDRTITWGFTDVTYTDPENPASEDRAHVRNTGRIGILGIKETTVTITGTLTVQWESVDGTTGKETFSLDRSFSPGSRDARCAQK